MAGGAEPDSVLLLFLFLWSVCFYLTDGQLFGFGGMMGGRGLYSLTGGFRGGSYWMFVTAEGGASVQPPISRLPEKIINK